MSALSYLFVACVLFLCIALALEAQPIALPPPKPRINIAKLVDALRQKENGPSSNLWQIQASVWHQYTHAPMKHASASEQRAVATDHVIWCLSVLKRLDLDYSVESVALVWRSGFGNIDRGTVPASHREFAKHVANLYYAP